MVKLVLEKYVKILLDELTKKTNCILNSETKSKF